MGKGCQALHSGVKCLGGPGWHFVVLAGWKDSSSNVISSRATPVYMVTLNTATEYPLGITESIRFLTLWTSLCLFGGDRGRANVDIL